MAVVLAKYLAHIFDVSDLPESIQVILLEHSKSNQIYSMNTVRGT